MIVTCCATHIVFEMATNKPKVCFAKVLFENQYKNIFYAKTVSILAIDDSLSVERFAVKYPEIVSKSKRNVQTTQPLPTPSSSAASQLDEADFDATRFSNIDVAIKNDFLSTFLKQFTHIIVDNPLEKAFLAEFVFESSTIVQLA